MSEVVGQQTYGDACECYIFVPAPGEGKGGEGKASGGEGKAGGEGSGKGSGEGGKGGHAGKAAVGSWVRVPGTRQGNQCLCGPTGALGERGGDAKGKTPGQRTVRP